MLNQAKQKYDELVYEMFVEVFRYIPLFTLVNESVFIVHGGKRSTPHMLTLYRLWI